MEKPAVVFNEEGWRLFLEFIKGGEVPKVQTDIVDDIVQQYYEKEKKTKQAKRSLEAVRDLAAEIVLESSEPIGGAEIREALKQKGYPMKPKPFSSFMNTVMKHHPEIKKVGWGLYHHEG